MILEALGLRDWAKEMMKCMFFYESFPDSGNKLQCIYGTGT